eukprot:TRINITY_DN6317_c0_g1_i1.p1 TRINITY_DN6317_c0_g1~~TRINITY_DN6317_c0_g1_i1.p1  ORF type:complete len:108 (-),score=2.35 TRINITY_DN6317_c0_g1_i1:13-336(-)
MLATMYKMMTIVHDTESWDERLFGSLLSLVLGNSAATTPDLLVSVLLLLDLLSGSLSLLGQAVSGQSVLGLVLLGSLQAVVDQSKSSGSSTTEDPVLCVDTLSLIHI